jgi:hypothetical protein
MVLVGSVTVEGVILKSRMRVRLTSIRELTLSERNADSALRNALESWEWRRDSLDDATSQTPSRFSVSYMELFQVDSAEDGPKGTLIHTGSVYSFYSGDDVPLGEVNSDGSVTVTVGSPSPAHEYATCGDTGALVSGMTFANDAAPREYASRWMLSCEEDESAELLIWDGSGVQTSILVFPNGEWVVREIQFVGEGFSGSLRVE